MLNRKKIKSLFAICLEDETAFLGLMPALEKLKQDLPDASLSLLTLPQHKEKARTLGFLHHILAYPSRSINQVDAEMIHKLIEQIRRGQYDTALIFTRRGHSPYLPAYVCYLAGIATRAGQSLEFGGGVLSHCFKPAPSGSDPKGEFLHLISVAGL